MPSEIIRVCAPLPTDNQYWAEPASVGNNGVTEIKVRHDNHERGCTWFDVYKGDQLYQSLNASFMEVVEYKVESD